MLTPGGLYAPGMNTPGRLWNLLDEPEAAPRIIDTHDPGVTAEHFASAREKPRWVAPPRWAIAIAAAIAVIALGTAWVNRPSSELTIVAESPPGARVEEALTTAPVTLLVHVVGAVARPGVVEVPVNSRVIDAIERAGGTSEDAVLEGVNLARVLFDGEQIVVPRLGEELPSHATPAGPISISRADSATLQTLPRIGPATAERIIAWRETHGPFRSVEDLLAVSGIGPATLEGLRPLIVP